MSMLEVAGPVRERRKVLRLTQSELADLAEVSERFVREVESGKSSVQLDKLQEVLAVLGLELQIVQFVPEALR
ncbi:transcriptional regulator, y4mF family [Corynebacterium epidermidicanis]|uniref:Transcriptional regulator, y4mF family n=2 Tax=Corynebacterium epidermidicanis TaxID=1050174 RepID=A0A0G3GZL3_9CORY|nr:transcriptional regulator, y4mF family [Corynebacterium epidermidicanis]